MNSTVGLLASMFLTVAALPAGADGSVKTEAALAGVRQFEVAAQWGVE